MLCLQIRFILLLFENKSFLLKIISQNATISQFEATIRFMGGLLGAYALTQDDVFKTKVVELTDRMQLVFDTPTGLPYRYINILSGVKELRH